MIVLISTHCDERVENALNRAAENGRRKIVTLFAEQLMPPADSLPEKKEEEG